MRQKRLSMPKSSSSCPERKPEAQRCPFTKEHPREPMTSKPQQPEPLTKVIPREPMTSKPQCSSDDPRREPVTSRPKYYGRRPSNCLQQPDQKPSRPITPNQNPSRPISRETPVRSLSPPDSASRRASNVSAASSFITTTYKITMRRKVVDESEGSSYGTSASELSGERSRGQSEFSDERSRRQSEFSDERSRRQSDFSDERSRRQSDFSDERSRR